jgi:hypothetical protein
VVLQTGTRHRAGHVRRSRESSARAETRGFVPDYCTESVTVARVWYSADDPGVEFTYDQIGDDYEYIDEIFLNDCRGKRVALSDVIAASHKNSLRRYEQWRRMKKKTGK